MAIDEFLLSGDTTDLNYPEIRPTLDLNFARTKTLDPRITFRRASGGSYFGPDGRLRYAGVNEPRFDHNPLTGECLGLLVEEQRTNNQRYSEDFSQGLTPLNATLSLNQEIAPDGNQTADRFLETTAVGLHAQEIKDFVFVSGITYTFSCFAKSIGDRTFCPGFPSLFGTAQFGRFSLTGAGSVLATDTGVTASIQAYPNGWYRCSITSTCANGGGARVGVFIGSGTSVSYAGDETKGLYLWGAQLETAAGGTSASFPTSYIPTTASAATRSADVASITGSAFSSWYRQDEGVLFASGDYIVAGAANFPRIVGLAGANLGTDEISLYTRINIGSGDGLLFGAVTVNSSLQGDLNAPSGSPNLSGGYRSALAYKANDFGLSSNGFAPTVDTSVTLPTITQLIIMGSLRFQNNPTGHVRRLTFWPQRLSNTTLQSITT